MTESPTPAPLLNARPATSSFVVFGVGQLGQLFAGGALRLGRSETPTVRDADPGLVLAAVPEGAPILLATPEAAMADAIGAVPAARRDDVILVQNELFPAVWEAAGAKAPTVAIVWLSKKKGRAVEVAGPTEVFGRHADVVAEIHAAQGLPVTVLNDEAALGAALVAKYAFILTINALGMVENLTLGDWLSRDEPQVRAVLSDALALGTAHLGADIDVEGARTRVLGAMEGLSNYPARGRTAAARVARARHDAERLGVALAGFAEIPAE